MQVHAILQTTEEPRMSRNFLSLRSLYFGLTALNFSHDNQRVLDLNNGLLEIRWRSYARYTFYNLNNDASAGHRNAL
jgi:hypothetical protein